MHIVITHGKQGVVDARCYALGGQGELLDLIGTGSLFGILVTIEGHCIIVTVDIGHLYGQCFIVDHKLQSRIGELFQ